MVLNQERAKEEVKKVVAELSNRTELDKILIKILSVNPIMFLSEQNLKNIANLVMDEQNGEYKNMHALASLESTIMSLEYGAVYEDFIKPFVRSYYKNVFTWFSDNSSLVSSIDDIESYSEDDEVKLIIILAYINLMQ